MNPSVRCLRLGYGLWDPPGLPASIVQRLNTEVNRWVGPPEVQAQFGRLGCEAQAGTPADFDRCVHADSERSAKIIKAAGIKAE